MTHDNLSRQMRKFISGFQVSQAIYVVAVLGIADLLAEQAQSDEALAAATGTNQTVLCRLMRELAGIGIFTESRPGLFAITELGRLLQSDRPDSLRPRAMLTGQEWIWLPWGRLLDGVVTGQSMFENLFNSTFFEYLWSHPQANELFQSAMSAGSDVRSRLLLHYDFSMVRSVVDVGGGEGELAIAVVRRYPHLMGVIFEQIPVAAAAAAKLSSLDVGNRCQVVAGDFLEGIGIRTDVYLLSQILHDWDDTRAIALLSNCRRAMRGQSRMLIVERVPSNGQTGHEGRLSDLNVMLLLGGQERSIEEYERLLNAAGLDLTRVITTLDGWGLLEVMARK